MAVVDSWPLVTLHHISKPAPGLSYGAAKPTIKRSRQKQTTRMSTGGLPPRAALANGVRTGKGKGNMKGSTDGTKRTE